MFPSFPTRNPLSSDTRACVVSLLNTTLAGVADVRSQCKNAHWNCKGATFLELHKFFDVLDDEFGGYADTIAERIAALGGYAQGTVRMAAGASFISEMPVGINHDALNYASLLADRFGVLSANLMNGIKTTAECGDEVTSNILAEVCAGVDKWLWFLGATLFPGK